MFFDILKKTVLRAACGLAIGFVAFSAGAVEPTHRPLDVVVFNYQDQQVFDVTVGGLRVGSAGRFPYSGRRSKVGARVDDGPQPVSWRYPGVDGGESRTVSARNTPSMFERTRDSRFMAVHIYPDSSVDLKFSEEFPVYTTRGKAISDDYDRRRANQ